MNDTKENKENTGWTTPTDLPAGWNQAEAERLAAFEQASRERSAAIRAQREATAERVEVVEVRDVTDPSRVYTPLERPERQPLQEREASAPELAGGDAASIEDKQGWEAQQGEIEAAELDAADIEVEGEAEQAAADPGAGWSQAQSAAAELDASIVHRQQGGHQVAQLSPAAEAALERIRASRAQERDSRDQELER
ncbi:hypothetical protein AAH461_005972 [Pseudomonas aeruginosa]